MYYDFGMMDCIPDTVRRGFVLLTFGIYENDAKVTCGDPLSSFFPIARDHEPWPSDGAEQMGILRTDIDRTSMEVVVREFLREFYSTVKTAKWGEMSDEEQRRVRKVALTSPCFPR